MVSRPIPAHTLEAYRRFAEGLQAQRLVSMTEEEELEALSGVRRVRAGEIILALLDEIDRRKAAFVPRPNFELAIGPDGCARRTSSVSLTAESLEPIEVTAAFRRCPMRLEPAGSCMLLLGHLTCAYCLEELPLTYPTSLLPSAELLPHIGMHGKPCRCTTESRARATRGCAVACYCHDLPHAACPDAHPCIGRCGRKTTSSETSSCGYCSHCAADSGWAEVWSSSEAER